METLIVIALCIFAAIVVGKVIHIRQEDKQFSKELYASFKNKNKKQLDDELRACRRKPKRDLNGEIDIYHIESSHYPPTK